MRYHSKLVTVAPLNSASSLHMQLGLMLSISVLSLAISRLVRYFVSIQIEGVVQLTQVFLRPSWAKFLHWVHRSFACAWGADRRFGVGSCRGSLVSKTWLSETVRSLLRCLSGLGSTGLMIGGTGRLWGVGCPGWLGHTADSDDGLGGWTRMTDADD